MIYKQNRDDDIQQNNINIRNPLPTSGNGGNVCFVVCHHPCSACTSRYLFLVSVFWHGTSLHLPTFYGNVFYTCDIFIQFLHAVTFLHVLHFDVLKRQIEIEIETELFQAIMLDGNPYIHSTTVLCDSDGNGLFCIIAIHKEMSVFSKDIKVEVTACQKRTKISRGQKYKFAVFFISFLKKGNSLTEILHVTSFLPS